MSFRNIEHKILFIEQICLTSIHKSFSFDIFILIDKTGHNDKDDDASKLCVIYFLFYLYSFLLLLDAHLFQAVARFQKDFHLSSSYGVEKISIGKIWMLKKRLRTREQVLRLNSFNKRYFQLLFHSSLSMCVIKFVFAIELFLDPFLNLERLKWIIPRSL